MRILPAIVLVLLVYLQYRLWVEPGGVVAMLRLKHQVETDQAGNQTLKQRNAALHFARHPRQK